jgi:hypothetical protein
MTTPDAGDSPSVKSWLVKLKGAELTPLFVEATTVQGPAEASAVRTTACASPEPSFNVVAVYGRQSPLVPAKVPHGPVFSPAIGVPRFGVKVTVTPPNTLLPYLSLTVADRFVVNAFLTTAFCGAVPGSGVIEFGGPGTLVSANVAGFTTGGTVAETE